MTFTISFGWWAVPSGITVIAMCWALFGPADDGGYFGGMVRFFMLVPALVASLLAWAIGGILK